MKILYMSRTMIQSIVRSIFLQFSRYAEHSQEYIPPVLQVYRVQSGVYSSSSPGMQSIVRSIFLQFSRYAGTAFTLIMFVSRTCILVLEYSQLHANVVNLIMFIFRTCILVLEYNQLQIILSPLLRITVDMVLLKIICQTFLKLKQITTLNSEY